MNIYALAITALIASIPYFIITAFVARELCKFALDPTSDIRQRLDRDGCRSNAMAVAVMILVALAWPYLAIRMKWEF